MVWFHNEESGQTFEVEPGSEWEKEARARGCKEVPAPKGAKSYASAQAPAPEPKDDEPKGEGQPKTDDEKTGGEPKGDEKSDAKGGKEKK